LSDSLDTIQYDNNLLQLGFHPVAVVLTLYTKDKNSNVHEEKQYRSQNTQNRKQKQQNKNKKKTNNLNGLKHNKG